MTVRIGIRAIIGVAALCAAVILSACAPSATNGVLAIKLEGGGVSLGTPFADGTVRIEAANGTLLRTLNIDEHRVYDVQTPQGTDVLYGAIPGEPCNPVRATVTAGRTSEVTIRCIGK